MGLGVRLPLIFLLGCGVVAGAESDLPKLRRKLAGERDPANRAKITVKIGEELLEQLSHRYQQGTYTDGEEILAEYLEVIRSAHQGLKQSGRDARRKPKGFKHLEVHLRKSERRLSDVSHILPFDDRQPLEKALEEMESIRLDLLGDLMNADLRPKTDDSEEERPPP